MISEADESVASLQRARLLIVDDDELFRRSTMLLLRSLNYDCDEAESTSAARSRLEQANYDLILMDRCMEGNFSLEGARAIGAGSQTPIIILTGFPSVESAIEAVDQRISGYLVKPIDPSKLRERIDQVLAASKVKTHGAAQIPSFLTSREADIVRELLEGYRVSTIARRLEISTNTVRRHLKSIFTKLQVSSQAALLEKLKPLS